MARQYFCSLLSDSSIVAASITPTTTKTFMLTNAQALQFLPIPYGANQPFAGQIFQFYAAGLITTPSTGTLIIDPTYGNGATTTTGGVSMGASPAQNTTASLSNIPWELSGQMVFRSIAQTATGSTAWLTGTFRSQGILATLGSAWMQPFGSTAAVSVDTSGTATAGNFGALNFYVTFSVTGATISIQHTRMVTFN